PVSYILAFHFEETKCLFGTDPVILNRSQMTRTTPELVLLPSNFRTIPAGGRLTYVRFKDHNHGGSSLEFEPGALRIRDLGTKPPRP
ncbi:hypothetical protein AVEN_109870-1, partial [Araneus ventricosus]